MDCVIGREPELAVLEEFLGWSTPALALLITGVQGIGKTVLWEEGLRLAGERGARVLAARASGAEAEMSFAGLFDLLGGIDIGAVSDLPLPQRQALEAALLRAEPVGGPAQRFAVAAGFLSVLRALAADQQLLIAVDDVQWLDAASAELLGFAARRAAGERFRFLLSSRSGSPAGLEAELGPGMVHRVEIGPLNLSGTRRLLARSLGLTLPPRTLSRVFDATQGNPLLALAIGRTLAQDQTWPVGTDLPVADLAGNPFGAQVAKLSGPAAHDAADLAERALGLTPPAAAEYPDRMLAFAQRLLEVGEVARVAELLGPWIGELPAGATRARAHLLLGEARSLAEHEAHLELALADSGTDRALRATVLAAKARLLALARIERIEEADTLASEALRLARSCGAEVQRYALHSLAWARILRGRPIDDLAENRPATLGTSSLYEGSIDRPAGVRLAFRGQAGQARAVFHAQLALADERGEALYAAVLNLHLCELELRAGEVSEASRRLRQWGESGAMEGLEPAYARCRALLAALAGRLDEMEQWAAAVAEPAATGDPWDKWDELELLRAHGLAALLAQEPGRAAGPLLAVWEQTRRAGVADPGAFPVAPDLVEALVWLDRTAEAADVTRELHDLSDGQEHPWGLVSSARCRAVIELAAGYDEQAATRLADAAASYGQLGLGFDRARSLLWLGRESRRARKRTAARLHLDEAAAEFSRLGLDGWARLARAEIDLLGSGHALPGELTPAEQRVAELAAAGLANKEIARQLFVAVHTVEVHLSHAYAKLGIRSRSQLAHLSGTPAGEELRSDN